MGGKLQISGSRRLLIILIISSLVFAFQVWVMVSMYPSHTAVTTNSVAQLVIMVGWLSFVSYRLIQRRKEEKENKKSG
jgi:phosphoglycerol transferase MdoB-like AlkP superfamily enzyme